MIIRCNFVLRSGAQIALAIKNATEMRIKRSIPKVSKEAAIKIALNTNGVSREIAEKYTDSELKEVLRLLKLKPNF